MVYSRIRPSRGQSRDPTGSLSEGEDAEHVRRWGKDGTVICLNTLLLALLTGTVRGYVHDPD
ncbi:MAG: hypothetical protein ABW279_05945, partial [Acidimicrobiales bacterium]